MEKLYLNLRNGIATALRDEAGQGLTEYAVIILFVVIAVVAALTGVGQVLSALFQQAAAAFP